MTFLVVVNKFDCWLNEIEGCNLFDNTRYIKVLMHIVKVAGREKLEGNSFFFILHLYKVFD